MYKFDHKVWIMYLWQQFQNIEFDFEIGNLGESLI